MDRVCELGSMQSKLSHITLSHRQVYGPSCKDQTKHHSVIVKAGIYMSRSFGQPRKPEDRLKLVRFRRKHTFGKGQTILEQAVNP
jgi:hypothetical protein